MISSGAPETAVSPVRDLYDVRVVRDVRIPTRDGHGSLGADLFLPITEAPVPALVTLLPYRKDAFAGIGGFSTYRWFARHGYATVLADLRGTGSSDGPRHPPFDPREGDDGAALVEWAGRQDWCSGSVGMWGVSYGAMTALRTAERGPKALRAILPVMGMLDPELDFVHPGGIRGALGPLGIWSLDTLLGHLLPPLSPAGGVDRRRWLERLEQDEPYLLDLFRHGPGHPSWRSRHIDASRIEVPTFCVAGWRDLFCEGTIRAYEAISAPKKLLVGPWMHTIPHESPFEAIDFHQLALDWWSAWLGEPGAEVERDGRVVLYVQGEQPRWQVQQSWPPAGDSLTWCATADNGLQRVDGISSIAEAAHLGAGYRRDPTVGALSGLWGVPTAGFGLPLDQHDDDLRSCHFTSRPLSNHLTIGGRMSVTVTLPKEPVLDRLVVKVTDVDPHGRSILVAAGAAAIHRSPATNGSARRTVRIELPPTAYEVAAGHRLRLVLAHDDFPRLWPDGSTGDSFVLIGAELRLPVLTDEGRTVMPAAPACSDQNERLSLHNRSRWDLVRSPIQDAVAVTIVHDTSAYTPTKDHVLTVDSRVTATASGQDASANVHGVAKAVIRSSQHESATVRVDLVVTPTSATATGEVSMDGVRVFAKSWTAFTDEPATPKGAIP
ncbi:CocE/NonD family hydrolase [Amycolatopsis thermoflava]|uniref:CocE/NonD family hydrolase n=1 Tax=Amycolatopsis thermoflava TaxID=84480 RepID=UPI00364DD926